MYLWIILRWISPDCTKLLTSRGAVLSSTSRLVGGLHTAGASGRIHKQQAPPVRVKQQHTASHSEGIGLTQLEDRKPNKGPVNLNPRWKYRKCLHSTFHHCTLGAQLRLLKLTVLSSHPSLYLLSVGRLCLQGIFRSKRPSVRHQIPAG